MSGTARDPVPHRVLDWNDGAVKTALQPPPDPPSLEPQPSGPPDQATSLLKIGPELRLSSVPPAPTTSGLDAGKLTDRCEQSSKAPRSPEAATRVQPCPAIWLKMLFRVVISLELHPKFSVQLQLVLNTRARLSETILL